LGRDFDKEVFPKVMDGGFVSPGKPAVPFHPGEENQDADSASSAAPSSEGSTSSRSPGAAASLERPVARAFYENDLINAQAAYPGMRVWDQGEGMWLMTESGVLPHLTKAATFLTAINFSNQLVKSWGFWREYAIGVRWIGPRHTNFNDGSICAFEPTDGTWTFGSSLVQLIDLYSVWALRHLHFELFGRWPGRQVAHHPF